MIVSVEAGVTLPAVGSAIRRAMHFHLSTLLSQGSGSGLAALVSQRWLGDAIASDAPVHLLCTAVEIAWSAAVRAATADNQPPADIERALLQLFEECNAVLVTVDSAQVGVSGSLQARHGAAIAAVRGTVVVLREIVHRCVLQCVLDLCCCHMGVS